MKLLVHFLNVVDGLEKTQIDEKVKQQLENDQLHYLRLINESKAIYGFNRKVGHKDEEKIVDSDSDLYKKDFFKSHSIGSSPYYSEYEALCISYAKIFSIKAGYSGITPKLFNFLLELMSDKSFKPKIPKLSSYSCGDVIPGTHWAQEVDKKLIKTKNYSIQQKDIMPLINGTFVHLGYSISLINKIKIAWALFIETTIICHNFTNANTSNLFYKSNSERAWSNQIVGFIKKSRNEKSENNSIQDPLSIRSTPQIIEALCFSIESYLNELDFLLAIPSGNPLFTEEKEYPLSQASFLAPTLSIKTESLIESLLFSMWSIIGRTNYFLSGKVANVSKDASSHKAPLGLIQYPKLMTAILEESRLKNGRRVFASGSSTSYGLEDLWSFGALTSTQLNVVLDDFIRLSCLELHVLSEVYYSNSIKSAYDSELFEISKKVSNENNRVKKISDHIAGGGLTKIINQFITANYDLNY